jgi:hypothetical protein
MLRFLFLSSVVLICFIAPSIAIGDSHNPKRIMPAEVIQKLNAGENILFLDTRTSRDWTASKVKIAGAFRVGSNEDLNRILRKAPMGRLIVTYCS